MEWEKDDCEVSEIESSGRGRGADGCGAGRGEWNEHTTTPHPPQFAGSFVTSMHVSPHDTKLPVHWVGSGGADDVEDAEDDVDEEADDSLVDEDSMVDDGSGLETGGNVTVVVCRVVSC